MKKIIKILMVAFLLFAPFFNLFADNEGGDLFLFPAYGNYAVGQTFGVDILVSSEKRAINAAEAVIVFTADFLEVKSISNQNSIFIFWPDEPQFSNKNGTINFAGGLPTPGYSGTGGKILRIIFRVKEAGIAEVAFKSGAVLANDGVGTNILSHFGNGKYNLSVAAPATEEKIEIMPAEAPATTTEIVPGVELPKECLKCEICERPNFVKIFFLSFILAFLTNFIIFKIIYNKKHICKIYRKIRKKINRRF